jgi:flagellar motor switch protein FliN/FliY
MAGQSEAVRRAALARIAPRASLDAASVVIRAQVPIISNSAMGLLRSPQPPAPTDAEDSSSASPASRDELRRILRMQVPVIVKLAERKLLLSEVMRLGIGAIIEFVKSSEEPLELLINNKPIAVGEAVKIGENFGLRIKQVGDVKQLIASLGVGH